MRRIATALTVAIALAIPTAASAASSGNRKPDRTALSAYASYVGSINSRVTKGRAADARFVAAASKNCRGQLSGDPDSTKAEKSALDQLSQELGADMTIEFLGEAKAPFATLSKRLSKLRWSGSAPKRTIRAFIQAETTTLRLKPSNLCGDVNLLASKPSAAPAATKAFLNRYYAATNKLQSQLEQFINLLEQYEVASENGTVTRIDAGVNKFDASRAAAVKASATKLGNVLLGS